MTECRRVHARAHTTTTPLGPKKMPNEGRVCAPWRLRKKSACVRACVCVGVARKACACKRIRFIIEGVTVLHAPHGPLFVRPQREHFVCVRVCASFKSVVVSRDVARYANIVQPFTGTAECVFVCVLCRNAFARNRHACHHRVFVSIQLTIFDFFCVSDTDNNICADFPV